MVRCRFPRDGMTSHRKTSMKGLPRRQAQRQPRFDGQTLTLCPKPCFRTARLSSHQDGAKSSPHRPCMPMNPSARLYHCARCHCQVIICRHCDRGHVYCTNGCAAQARSESLKRAAKRYRSTRRGRHNNADRQRRFRARKREKVTHQGSPPLLGLALLLCAWNTGESPREDERPSRQTAIYCHLCHCECDPFLRHDFLRPPTGGKPHRSV